MQPNTVESGARLADRYRLEEQLKAEDGFTAWRAVDEKLSRYVGVYVLPVDHPRAKAVVEAAQAAAMLTDNRFCQVLDASQHGDSVYVVKEWLRGRDLATLLQGGPLRASEAAGFTEQVAGALQAAHDAGLCHLRLSPRNVVRTETGQVKVVDLTVDAALHGTECEDTAAEDARALGAVLYACLTARWPTGDGEGLPVAPYENGVLCSPRQVRAGVPAALDELAMRALGQRTGHGAEPLRSPAEVASALATVPRRRHDPPPQPTTRIATSSPVMPPPVMPAPPPVHGRPAMSLTGRLIWTAAALVLLAGLALLAYSVAQNSGTAGNSASSTPSASTASSGTPVDIVGAQDFDPRPDGDGEEHHNEVQLAYDGDTDTAWTTREYRNHATLGNLKKGVGLVFDLGSAQRVGAVKITTQGSGTSLQLLAADSGASGQPTSYSDFSLVKEAEGVSGTVTVRPSNPVTTRYLLVWLTSLPAAGANTYRGGIVEVSVTH